MIKSSALAGLLLGSAHLAFVGAVRQEGEEGNGNLNPIFANAVARGMQSKGRGGTAVPTYGYYDYAPPPTPKWEEMPLGCERDLNRQLCVMALFFESTNSSDGVNSGGISAVDMCNHIWIKERSWLSKEDRGLTPRHYQCLAVASDHGLQRAAERIRPLRPQDPALYKDWDKESRLDKFFVRILGDMAEEWEPLAEKVDSFCRDRLTIGKAMMGGDYGFCRSPSREGQDCTFYGGIKENWGTNNGRDYCDSLDADAAKYRCLSLRKQLVKIGQAISAIGSVKFISFETIESHMKSSSKLVKSCT